MQHKKMMRWVMKVADETRSRELAKALNVSLEVGRLLVQRNKVSVDEARRFLYPERSGFYDPYLMKDMRKATERIRCAIARQEPIMIYGDYDADGATSTSLLFLALNQLGACVEYYIPDRFSEGYGLNETAIRQAKEKGFSLVITVDNGISALQEVRIAKEIGLDLIITDHHTPPEQLPDAYAILNPKQAGCEYPDKMLAGVGVVFKLVQALFGRLPEEYLELAAIGTVSDLAPLDDENRLITVFGLEQMNQQPGVGVQALIEVAGLSGKRLTAGHIGFFFGPRINAAGRLDSATSAVELLVTQDSLRAKELAAFLEEQNRERREIGDQIFAEAVDEMERHPQWLDRRVLVLAREDWNAGVIGIVASRLVERYNRPVLMISITDSMGKGSARSIPPFPMYDALHACEDLLEHYGGHKQAAGFSIREEHIPFLRTRLNQLADEWLSEEDMIPQLAVDGQLRLPDVDVPFVEQVEALAPFGFGNPSPRFQLRDMDLLACRVVGKQGEHLQFTIGQGMAQIGCIAFRCGEDLKKLETSSHLDVVGEIQINEWNGQRRLQINVADWRQSAVQIHDLRHVKDKICWIREMAKSRPLTVVCFTESGYQEVTKVFARYLWEEPSTCRIVKLNETGKLPADSELQQDVAVFDVPVSLNQFHVFLKDAGENVHLYLLHGETEYRRALAELKTSLPDRSVFADVYRTLLRLGKATRDELAKQMQRDYTDQLEWMLQVFIELGFAYRQGNTYYVVKDAAKRSLQEAKSYCQRRQWAECRKRVIEVFFHWTAAQIKERLLDNGQAHGEECIS